MQVRITSPALSEPWEGDLELILGLHVELPEHTRRRIEGLQVGERISPPFPEHFEIERLS